MKGYPWHGYLPHMNQKYDVFYAYPSIHQSPQRLLIQYIVKNAEVTTESYTDGLTMGSYARRRGWIDAWRVTNRVASVANRWHGLNRTSIAQFCRTRARNGVGVEFLARCLRRQRARKTAASGESNSHCFIVKTIETHLLRSSFQLIKTWLYVKWH